MTTGDGTGDGTACKLEMGVGSKAHRQPVRDSRQFSSRRHHRGDRDHLAYWDFIASFVCAHCVRGSGSGACVSWIYGNGKVKWHWINNKKKTSNKKSEIQIEIEIVIVENRVRGDTIRKRLTLSGPWLMTSECVAPQEAGTAAKKLQRGANPDGATAEHCR